MIQWKFWQAVMIVLLWGPQYGGDRRDTLEQRVALYTPVAYAIAEASEGSERKAAALIALGRSESSLARYVIEGRCLDGPSGARCDSELVRGVLRPRARGPWQVWSWCREAWEAPDGSYESLVGGARCAVKLLERSRKKCHGLHPAGDLAGMFSGYRRASSCFWPSGATRAYAMETARGRLGAELRKLRRQDLSDGPSQGE